MGKIRGMIDNGDELLKRVEEGGDLTREERDVLKGRKDVAHFSEEEHRRKLAIITGETLKLLVSETEWFATEFGASSDVVGWIIFGSWVQKDDGKPVAHKGSDIDMMAIATQDPADYPGVFVGFLEKELKKRGVDNEIECHDPVITTDADAVAEIVEGKDEFTNPGYVVVSPFPRVVDLFRGEKLIELENESSPGYK